MTGRSAFAARATIARNRYEYTRRLYALAHPTPTPTQRLRAYEFNHARFTQDLWWFPETMWLGTVKRDDSYNT